MVLHEEQKYLKSKNLCCICGQLAGYEVKSGEEIELLCEEHMRENLELINEK